MNSFSRRSFLSVSSAAFSLTIASWLEGRANAKIMTAPPKPRVRSVIVLWMNGGPSHIDTWDPKPGTAVGGSHKAIPTAIANVSISEHLPNVAAMAKKITIVRSMTSKEGNHQRAQYLMRTGYSPNPTVIHPSLGAWVAREKGPLANGLPSFVSIGGPSLGGGVLGVQYGPLVVPTSGQIPPNLARSAGISEARMASRRALLGKTEANYESSTSDGKVADRKNVYLAADRLMQSTQSTAFDLTNESETTKKSFGDTEFGRGCLQAVRLVGAGVNFVEVMLDGWDTHKDNFTRTQTLKGVLDPAMSSLFRELEARGLDKETLVLCIGDFGRTPKINENDGRDHFPSAWSCVLGGAGVRTGQVFGETDAEGAKVVKDPVTVPDLMATIARILDIKQSTNVIAPSGRPIAITDNGTVIEGLITW